MARRRQLHCWISDVDYEFLQDASRRRDEPVSATLRRTIRSLRERTLSQDDVGRVPQPPKPPFK